jgi:outer membrane murein-binding lipoprotein Lpp
VIDRLGWIAPVGQASQKTEGADDDKIISSVGDLSDTELVRRLEAEHEHTRAAMIAEGVTIHSIPPFADILAKFQSAGEAEAPKIHTDASRAEIAWLDAKIAELEGDAEALRETLDSTPAADISFRSTTREALGKAEVGLVLARARRAARAA